VCSKDGLDLSPHQLNNYETFSCSDLSHTSESPLSEKVKSDTCENANCPNTSSSVLSASALRHECFITPSEDGGNPVLTRQASSAEPSSYSCLELNFSHKQYRQWTITYTGARSCKYCCSGKTTSITYPSICNLSYPAFNARAPYYIVICGVRLYIFSHHPIKGQDFRKNLTENVCFFISSTAVV
jgi:hypothetical protein